MLTLIKNENDTNIDCTDTLSLQRVVVDLTNNDAELNLIRAEIMLLDSTITASTDPKIKTIKKATSFPVGELLHMIADNPCYKYLRVYNGFNSGGEYVTYLCLIPDVNETIEPRSTSATITISKSCCHCKQCASDRLLNP